MKKMNSGEESERTCRRLLGSLVIAFSMYSSIPMPTVEWTSGRMKYAMCFFPLVGAVTGFLTCGSYLALLWLGFGRMAHIFPAAVPLLLTGGIHMDGFLDVIDARSSHKEREKKLEILKDPHTGAFAIIGCGVYLIAYISIFQALEPAFLPAYGAVFVVTRALSGLSVVTFPLAKGTGLAAAFSRQAQKKAVAAAMVVILAAAEVFIAYVSTVTAALIMGVTAGLVYWYYYRMAKREFGGITGDLAGYFLQLCEFFLMAAAVVAFHLAGI